MTTLNAEKLRAIVRAAVDYVDDEDGEPDASGLDASERLSEAVCGIALPLTIPHGSGSDVEVDVVRAALRLVMGGQPGASSQLDEAVAVYRRAMEPDQ